MADLWAQSRQNQQTQDAIQPPAAFTMPQMPQAPLPASVFVPSGPVGRPMNPQERNIDADTQALQKVRWQESHPWSTPPTYDANGVQTDPGNHPGKLGKIAHIFSQIGNIAGDIFAPAVAANIPGSQLNMEMKEGGLVKRLNTDVGAKSANDYRDAETAKTQQDTAEAPRKAQDAHDTSEDMQGNLESETRDRDAAASTPSLAAGYAHAVQDAIKRGVDPAQDPIVQHLSDAITSLQPGQNKTPEAPKTIPIQVGGKPHQMAWDAKTGKYDLDQGENGEKPPSVRVNTGEGRIEKNDLLKAYQPTLDSAERMNVMTESYEKAINDHDQQAMLNLLANHLGMTMGLQKGARLTKDIINEAKQSQPWLQGIESKFDKDGYLSGVTLSPQQMRQMVALGQERYAEDAKKSRSTAQYLGAKDDGPDRVPGRATINYYMGLANGDKDKAKSLAAADGWTVK